MSGVAGHPSNVVLLTADAFGVMPPIAKLTPAQAIYHFLSGFTAKVAGTEKGVTEPQPTFSACFGAPFMARHPTVYAELLLRAIERHGPACWLVNTGWTGGPYGTGQRIPLPLTRKMLDAAIAGELEGKFRTDEHFGFAVPVAISGVPHDILDPVRTWADQAAFHQQANRLAEMFKQNFARFESLVPPAVGAAGPTIRAG